MRENGMPARRHRGPMGPGPGFVGEKPKDFKGSSKKLIKYLGKYWIAIVIVMIFAAASTVFSVAGPKVMGKATTALAEGLMDRLQTSDNYIDFAAFPKAKSFTVELLDKNGNKVATGNYSSGDDAISILVEDAPLVFDTADNGIVPSDVTKTAKVKVMRGNTNVTNDCNQESSRDDLSSNCMCDVTKDEAIVRKATKK